jgi:hypothetical protein
MRVLTKTVLVCFGVLFGVLHAQTDEVSLSKFIEAVNTKWQHLAGLSAHHNT